VIYNPNYPNTAIQMPQILHKDLSYRLTGLLFKVHKELGRFARERQYGDKLENLLKADGLEFQREYDIKKLEAASPKGNRVDFLVSKVIIVDLKAKPFITKEDYFQMRRYLQASNLELGIIVNFRVYKLAPKRVLNSSYSDHTDKNLYH